MSKSKRKVFNKIISFHVQGEIYDPYHATPDSIINNYNWSFDEDDNGDIRMIGSHKDHRGRISKIVRLAKIKNWIKPDTEIVLDM